MSSKYFPYSKGIMLAKMLPISSLHIYNQSKIDFTNCINGGTNTLNKYIKMILSQNTINLITSRGRQNMETEIKAGFLEK
jgi:hypothetical protein